MEFLDSWKTTHMERRPHARLAARMEVPEVQDVNMGSTNIQC